MGSFSIWHWIIVLVIVMLIFGTKKLRNVGQDLGGAVKGFKDGMKESAVGMSNDQPRESVTQQASDQIIGVEVNKQSREFEFS